MGKQCGSRSAEVKQSYGGNRIYSIQQAPIWF